MNGFFNGRNRSLAAGVLACSSLWAHPPEGSSGGHPKGLPEGIVDTQPGTEQPPGPEESVELLSVPKGFQLSLFAGEPDVAQPIAIEYDDRGRLWVLESFSYIEWKRTGKDRLLIFEDTDNDGRFDSRKVFWDRGNHTSGFQIGHGGVWLCDAPDLLFIPDRDRDDVPDGEPRVVLDGWTTLAEHNFFNGLKWGPDGWLYGRHGLKAPSLVGPPGTPEEQRVAMSSGIWRYHPVKERFEVWAEGTVNPWGLDWNEEGEGFIHTSVIDHLWHLVPGARYRRSSGKAADERHSYALMEATSDHRHWSGGQTGRKQFDSNDEAGGGHSHSGMVIYQSEAWPETYRGRAFFSNVLGQRINSDHLVRSGAAWTATHGEDFLRSSSEWFRGVDLCQGPSGELMVAEWTDLGECHDRDGIHRSSGRLYEIWHGERPGRTVWDVAVESMESLLKLGLHENVWWRRHALRNLHERAAAGAILTDRQIESLVETAAAAPVRDAVSAVQILHALRPLDMEWIQPVMEASLERGRAPVRTHLITLVMTEEPPEGQWLSWFESLCASETDPAAQYRLMALLQRLPVESRWTAAERLAKLPVEETNVALMRWYGIEPLVGRDPERAMMLARQPGHRFLSEAISRRLVDHGQLGVAVTSLSADSEVEAETLAAVLQGWLKALPSQSDLPEGWPDLYPRLGGHSHAEVQRLAFELALRFGDVRAMEKMVERVLDPQEPLEDRRGFLNLLITARADALGPHLPALMNEPGLRLDAIRAQALFPSSDSVNQLLGLIQSEASPGEELRATVLETLASRSEFADPLVEAVLDGQVPKEWISAYLARQILSVASQSEAFETFMGLDAKGEAQKAKLIATWKKRLSEEVLAEADPVEGREVYRRSCSACHQLYGEGGIVGPDLTGSGRADLDYFLINVLFPSEDVAPEYRLTTLVLKDGRTLSGTVVEENANVLTLSQVGQEQRIDVAEIESRQVSEISLMPPGLLDGLRREDIRDLVAYLRTTKPLP